MSLGSNQQIFEEFQRSVDQAHTLALRLGPEHFYLAYDRCAKLQKVIFKRACGYCSTNKMNSTSKELKIQENNNIKSTPFNMCYLNLPTLSLCCPQTPIIAPRKPNEDVLVISKLILLHHNEQSVLPLSELEREARVAHNCVVSPSPTVHETIQCLLRNFPGEASPNTEYELCVLQSDMPTNQLTALHDSDMPPRASTLFIRPISVTNTEIKAESSLSPLSLSTSDESGRINSFITDNGAGDNINSTEANGLVFPDTVFSPMEVEPCVPQVSRTKPQRKYNWSVTLTQLHEKMPVSLNNEILPSPSKCHELYVIPPTTQKLRPTKRCQLCLKGYRSRKESRYYCRACDKGFHIKCFELYHAQLGCADFRVKIIGTEH